MDRNSRATVRHFALVVYTANFVRQSQTDRASLLVVPNLLAPALHCCPNGPVARTSLLSTEFVERRRRFRLPLKISKLELIPQSEFHYAGVGEQALEISKSGPLVDSGNQRLNVEPGQVHHVENLPLEFQAMTFCVGHEPTLAEAYGSPIRRSRSA